MKAISEPAFAKVNLALRVGPPRADGMHPLASLFASIDLADEVRVGPATGGAHEVVCDGVAGENLCATTLSEYEHEQGEALEPLRVEIAKRIPIAAGLGGGSADAAALLRVLDRSAAAPLGPDRLLAVAARLGADVPSQVEPRHALVTGIGERIEPVALPPLGLVLVPSERGLSTADVFAEFDRIEAWRETLDPDGLRPETPGSGAFTAADLTATADNDLAAATLSLRPELEQTLAALRATAPLFVMITGSGPTCFAAYPTRADAEGALDLLTPTPGTHPPIVCSIRQN